MFLSYGEIKSAKVSIHPDHSSKGYGFVWFAEESSALKVIEDSKNEKIPFKCLLYKPRNL